MRNTVCESLWVFSMEGVDPKTRRKLLVQFYNLHKSAGKSWTENHFSQLAIARASATQRFLRTIRREAAPKKSQDLTYQQSSFLLPKEDALSSPSKTKEGAWWSLPRSSRCVMAHLDVLARRAQPLLARTPLQWLLHLLVRLSKLPICPSRHHPLRRAINTIFAKAENPRSVAKLQVMEDVWDLLKGKVSQAG